MRNGTLLRQTSRSILKYGFILGCLFLVLFPLFYLIVTSIRPEGEFLRDVNILPDNYTLNHYKEVFRNQRAFTYLKNSILITTIVTAVSLLIGTMAGYAISRAKLKYWLISLVIFFLIFIRFYPRISVVVPWFLLLNKFQLLDTIWAVIILHLGLTVPFVIWLMYTFFQGIPKEIEECASVDGASFGQRFRKIVLPLSLPGVASAAIFTAFLSWNEFLLASAVTRENAKTLPVVVAGFITDKGVIWGPMMAMSALIIVPMCIFALVLQKYLVKGMMLGAVKE